MQDEMLRRHLITHASRLDAFSSVREEVQDIARARDAAGVMEPTQIGAGKGRARTSRAKANRLMSLVVLMIITIVQETVSALQENDVSWILTDSGLAVYCMPIDARSRGANHPGPRKSADRCRHEPQD